MNKNRNSKQNLVKKLKNRIHWLENLVERSSSYINQLETELRNLKQKYFELKKDHSGLINWYWKAQDLLEENKRLKSENERFKHSNEALKLLLKEIVQELDRPFKKEIQERKKEQDNKLEFRWSEPCQTEFDHISENVDEKSDQLKSELRKVITQKLRKHNLDIKV